MEFFLLFIYILEKQWKTQSIWDMEKKIPPSCRAMYFAVFVHFWWTEAEVCHHQRELSTGRESVSSLCIMGKFILGTSGPFFSKCYHTEDETWWFYSLLCTLQRTTAKKRSSGNLTWIQKHNSKLQIQNSLVCGEDDVKI